MKSLLVALLTITLVACSREPAKSFEKSEPGSTWVSSSTRLATTEDGCTISKVNVRDTTSLSDNRDLYVVSCPMQSVSTQWKCGKAQCYSANVPKPEVSPEEVARIKALSKLSADDKAALGIK